MSEEEGVMSHGQDHGARGAGIHAPYPKDPNEIGALWMKKTEKGGTWFSGIIENRRVVVFWNGPKKNPKAPDYRVLLSTGARHHD